MVARGDFYSYYNFQCEEINQRREKLQISFMHTKKFTHFFKDLTQFRVGFDSMPTNLTYNEYGRSTETKSSRTKVTWS